MSSQVALAVGVVNGRVHTDQDPALLRNVELALLSERRTRRARRVAVRRQR